MARWARWAVIGLCNEADAYTLLSEPIGTMITEGEQKAEIEIELISTKYPAIETVAYLKLIQKYEEEDNMEFTQQIKELLEQFLLADNCEYAATARAVVNDPDAFGL